MKLCQCGEKTVNTIKVQEKPQKGEASVESIRVCFRCGREYKIRFPRNSEGKVIS